MMKQELEKLVCFELLPSEWKEAEKIYLENELITKKEVAELVKKQKKRYTKERFWKAKKLEFVQMYVKDECARLRKKLEECKDEYHSLQLWGELKAMERVLKFME